MPVISEHDIHTQVLGNGAPALMIHCALGRANGLAPLATKLPYQTALFDLPGHGRSGAWNGQGDYQKQVSEIAAELCDVPRHVIGHSFGATAALRLAVEKPALVTGLTLIEPVYFAAAKGTDAHWQLMRQFRPFAGAMLTGDETRAAEIFNDIWGAIAWDKLPAAAQQQLAARIYLVVAGASAIEEDADGITSAQRLASLQIPVTLIRGGETHPVMADIHETLCARISGAKDHVIDGAGHMVPLTHAQEVADIIRAADSETG